MKKAHGSTSTSKIGTTAQTLGGKAKKKTKSKMAYKTYHK